MDLITLNYDEASKYASLTAAAPEMFNALRAITDCWGVRLAQPREVLQVEDFMTQGREVIERIENKVPSLKD